MISEHQMNWMHQFHFAFIGKLFFGHLKNLTHIIVHAGAICCCSHLAQTHTPTHRVCVCVFRSSFSFRSISNAVHHLLFASHELLFMDNSFSFQCRAHDRAIPRTAWCRTVLH